MSGTSEKEQEIRRNQDPSRSCLPDARDEQLSTRDREAERREKPVQMRAKIRQDERH